MELTSLFLFEQKADWAAGSLWTLGKEKNLLTPEEKRKHFSFVQTTA